MGTKITKTAVTPLLTREQIKAALEALSRHTPTQQFLWRNRLAIFALVTCAGFKPSELVSLNMGDFNLTLKHFECCGRMVPIWTEAAEAAISDYFVVTTKSGGNRRLTAGNACAMYRNACRLAGLGDHQLVSTGIRSFRACFSRR